MELRRYAAIIMRWWWLLALGLLVGGAAAFGLSRTRPRVYEARATILVNQAQAVTGPSYNDVLANQQLSKTYKELVTSAPVLEKVGATYDLTYEQLLKQVSAGVRADTQLIDVTVRDRDPQRAADIANATAKVFADQIRQAQLGQQSSAEGDLTKQAAAVQASIDQKQQTVRQLSSPQFGLPEDQRQQQLAQAQSDLSSLNQTLADLQRQIENLRIDLAKSINSVTLANPARLPAHPVSPRTTVNTLIGALLGLLAAGCVIAAAEYLDDTVKTPEDVDRAVGAPTLGEIARFSAPGESSRWGRRQPAPHVLTRLDAHAPAAESYRVLRANLEFARSVQPDQTMLITSALPGEGKSTTAANLAVVLAQTGRRVILVDADLRRPSLHELLDVSNAVGLSTLFLFRMGESALESVLQTTSLDNLLVLPSGPLPPNPAELLSSARMGEVVETLKSAADVVVFDSPPLLGVADSAALASRLDGVVLVVEAGRARPAVLAQAAAALHRAQATLWGVALNKLRPHRGEGYYYYQYASHTNVDDGPVAHVNGVRPPVRERT